MAGGSGPECFVIIEANDISSGTFTTSLLFTPQRGLSLPSQLDDQAHVSAPVSSGTHTISKCDPDTINTPKLRPHTTTAYEARAKSTTNERHFLVMVWVTLPGSDAPVVIHGQQDRVEKDGC